MSSSVSIRHLTKKYRIATRRPGFGIGALGGAVSRLRGSTGYDTLLALDDVSFDVAQGEVVGLVGRNGAGKSTLLKILSRIVEPDGGEVLLQGRVGSLLEVGTGFHPELTGRENIYLNGAILGMRRTAITRAFDSIVDFAGTEQFLDTPVKRYSSGMYVRLAFAVAAHLDTEILLIDEVLAVGDAAFQAKCLAKIGDVSSSEGRTVLFVSHNMAAVETLCTRAVYVAGGRVLDDGSAPAVVARYHGDLFAASAAGAVGSFVLSGRANAFDVDQPVVINALRIEDAAGQPTTGIQGGEELVVEVDLCHLHGVRSPVVAVMVNDHAGRILATMSTRMAGSGVSLTAAGSEVTVRLRAFELALAPGDYWLTVGVKDATHDRKVDAVERIGPLHVAAGNFFGTGYLPSTKDGVMLVRHEWSVAP